MIIEKTYICTIIGSGTYEDPRRPALADQAIGEKSWFMVELGKVKGNDWCLISIVADEADHEKIVLDKDEIHFATKMSLQIDSAKLDELKTKFSKLLEKWEVAKKSWVTLGQKTGKEE